MPSQQPCPQLRWGCHRIAPSRQASLQTPEKKICPLPASPLAAPLAAATPLPARCPATPFCRLHLSHTCCALRAASSAGWFPEVRVTLDEDTDAEALGGWLRRTQGECCGVKRMHFSAVHAQVGS